MKPMVEFVSFDAPTSLPDGQGGTEDGWTNNAHICRAHFLYLRGGETVQQARLQGKQPIVVTIRGTSPRAKAITPAYRMRDTQRGDDYNIRSIVPTEDRLFLEMTCEKGVTV